MVLDYASVVLKRLSYFNKNLIGFNEKTMVKVMVKFD